MNVRMNETIWCIDEGCKEGMRRVWNVLCVCERGGVVDVKCAKERMKSVCVEMVIEMVWKRGCFWLHLGLFVKRKEGRGAERVGRVGARGEAREVVKYCR